MNIFEDYKQLLEKYNNAVAQRDAFEQGLINSRKQHDELLVALRDIVNYDEARRKTASQDPGIMPKSVVCKIAEAAIAKAKT